MPFCILLALLNHLSVVFFRFGQKKMPSRTSYVYEKAYKKTWWTWVATVVVIVATWLVFYEYSRCYSIASKKYNDEVNVDRQICNPDARKSLPIRHITMCEGEHLAILHAGPRALAIKCTVDTFNFMTNGYIRDTVHGWFGGVWGFFAMFTAILFMIFKFGNLPKFALQLWYGARRTARSARIKFVDHRERKQPLLPTSISDENGAFLLSNAQFTNTEMDHFLNGNDMTSRTQQVNLDESPYKHSDKSRASIFRYDGDSDDGDGDDGDGEKEDEKDIKKREKIQTMVSVLQKHLGIQTGACSANIAGNKKKN